MSGLVLLADLHAGMSTHDREGSWRRAECRAVVRAAVSAANARRSHLVIAGDVFHSRKPPAWAYLAVGEELSRADRDVYVIPGNHDSDTASGTTPLGVLAAYGATIVTRPCAVEAGGFSVLMLPWPNRAWMAAHAPESSVANQHEQMAEAIQVLVASHAVSAAAPSIVVAHMTIAGAGYNSGTQPALGDSSEFIAPLTHVTHPRLAAVFSGHIHKPQTLESGACPVHYIGSAVRHDFGEEEQSCRMLYVKDAYQEALPLPAVEFRTFALDEEPHASEIEGRVVRLKGSAPAGPETAALVAKRHAHFVQCGARAIGKPAITYVRHEVARDTRTLHVRLTTTEALSVYCDEAGGEYGERKNELLALHCALRDTN